MQHQRNIALLQRRRDGIRQWLDDEAPYTAGDQRHLDQNTPERAYWHHGYQAALDDVIALAHATGANIRQRGQLHIVPLGRSGCSLLPGGLKSWNSWHSFSKAVCDEAE